MNPEEIAAAYEALLARNEAEILKNAALTNEIETAKLESTEALAALQSANDRLTNEKDKLTEALEYATKHDLAVEKARAEQFRKGFETQSRMHEEAIAANATLRQEIETLKKTAPHA